jgi:hypothetical protein
MTTVVDINDSVISYTYTTSGSTVLLTSITCNGIPGPTATLPVNITRIADNVGLATSTNGLQQITTLIVGENVRHIGKHVFKYWTSLTNLNLLCNDIITVEYDELVDENENISLIFTQFIGSSVQNLSVKYFESGNSANIYTGLFPLYHLLQNISTLKNVVITGVTLSSTGELHNNFRISDKIPGYIEKINMAAANSITTLKSFAFSNFTLLTEIILPSSIVSIATDAFINCPSLNTETIQNIYNLMNNNVTIFKNTGLTALQAFEVGISSTDALSAGYTQSELTVAGYDLSFEMIISNNVLTDITYITEPLIKNITIPTGVTAINSDACQNKTFIGSLSIPSTVTRILANSFLGCNNLTAVTLPGSRTSSSNSLIPLDANSFALATSPSLIRSNVNVNSLQQLRTQGYTVAQLEAAGFQNVPVTCFGENTRIMCFVDGQEQELMVQDIRNGVLVKTLGSGYKPVCMIGTNKMMNLGNDERVEERLYVCKKENYTELTEDLIITGCHSVLVDDITEEQRNKIMDKFGRIMVTEGKYRLTAAMDERAFPHNCAGEFNIYHFALEHDVYVANYGVYANGLLVESCSKRYLAEIANMTMIA